jgi:ATP-dependent DNA ligase
MTKQTFYQKDRKDRIRQWSIWTEKGKGDEVVIVTEDGLVGGKLKGSRVPIKKGSGKNSIQEQADFDCQSVINLKLKAGMSADINDLTTKGDTATIKAPMKAETLKLVPANDKEAKRTYTVAKTGYEGKKVRYDAKLDGWRFRLRITKTEEIFYTSSGDVTLPFPQIAAAARKVFDKNIAYWEEKYGITEHILDGELYTHGLQLIRDAKDNITGHFFKPNTSGFAAAASAGGCGKGKTKQSDLTPMQREIRDLMQFQLFDVVVDDPKVLDDTRMKIISYYFDKKVIVEVPHFFDTFTTDNVKKYMKEMLSLGYEGLMVKVPGHPYIHNRSKMIFKHKPLEDAEFEIIEFEESTNGDTLGSIWFINEDGNKFKATPMDDWGTDAMKKEIWDNQSKYKGKFATVVFMELTPDGVPRHGRVKGFRKGKSKD